MTSGEFSLVGSNNAVRLSSKSYRQNSAASYAHFVDLPQNRYLVRIEVPDDVYDARRVTDPLPVAGMPNLTACPASHWAMTDGRLQALSIVLGMKI